MTKQEFFIEHERLCRGFRHQASELQVEAWFQRVSFASHAVWKETVTTLLCGRHFPKIEDALDEIEQEAGRQRKVKLEQDRLDAARMVARLQQESQIEDDPSRVPTPSTPLFACIKSCAGRGQVRFYLSRLDQRHHWSDGQKIRERARLLAAEADLTTEIDTLIDKIHPNDARRLLGKYESQEAV